MRNLEVREIEEVNGGEVSGQGLLATVGAMIVAAALAPVSVAVGAGVGIAIITASAAHEIGSMGQPGQEGGEDAK